VEVPLKPENVVHIGHFFITNSLLMSWLVMSTLIILGLLATRHIKLHPGKLQNFMEYILETLYDLVKSVAADRARVFFPIIATLFLFILCANWFGLIPGLNAIGIYEHSAHGTVFVPLFRSAASDLNTTLALALITVILTQYYGIRFNGIYGYVKRYFHNPLQGGIAFILLGIAIGGFVGFLEVVSEFVKIISLSFRLFGNVYAGDVVISTITGMAGYIAPVPFLMLETIVGLVQATVFALLTLVFFSIISQPVEHDAH
jgi:F-type H+-transporting ATPase subunit a